MPETPLQSYIFIFKQCHTKLTSIAQFQLDLESNYTFHCQVMDISNQLIGGCETNK